MSNDFVQLMDTALFWTTPASCEPPIVERLGQEGCLVATSPNDVGCSDQSSHTGNPNSLEAHRDEVDWDDDYLADLYSDLAEQYDWQERLVEGRAIAHCCTRCAYFCRAFNPAIPCAVHPDGPGTDVRVPNDCPDWTPPDVTWALTALTQTLPEHPVTAGKQWTILCLAYPDERMVEALVQVEQERHQWSIYGWVNPDRSRFQVDVCYSSPCWKNLGDREIYVVWIHPNQAPFAP